MNEHDDGTNNNNRTGAGEGALATKPVLKRAAWDKTSYGLSTMTPSELAEFRAAERALAQERAELNAGRTLMMQAMDMTGLNERVESTIRLLQSDGDKRTIMSAFGLFNASQGKGDNGTVTLVNFYNGNVWKMSRMAIKSILGEHDFEQFVRNRVVAANFSYEPYANTSAVYIDQNNVKCFNEYVPPKWKRWYYLQGLEVPVAKEVPALYKRFFLHLVKGHEPSYEYLLDWMANSLKRRNLTMLVAIGNQGVGKGVLYGILAALHGPHNSTYTGDGIFKDKFNGPVLNKTFLNVDEVDLGKKDQIDRLKMLSNDEIQVELKGQDQRTVRNHANIYISSNHFDAIEISRDDRRYSVIEITETRAVEVFTTAELDRMSTDEVLVAELASYLWHRPVDAHKMKLPFTNSERWGEVRESRMSAWEYYILETWSYKYAGRGRIPLKEVQMEMASDLRLQGGRIPGKRAFDRLFRANQNVIRLHKPAKGGLFLESLVEKEVPSAQVLKLMQGKDAATTGDTDDSEK